MIAVLVNPRAFGVRRRPGLVGELRALVGDRGTVHETRDPSEVPSLVEGFHQRGVKLIAVCGGDGTNLCVLTALNRVYADRALPRMAFLRGGTVNTVANNLGVRGRPIELLTAVLAGRTATLHQDTIVANGRCGFLFAAAMGARFLEAYYRLPQPGPMWATLLALRTAGSSLISGPLARQLFAPMDVALEVDGVDRSIGPPRLFVASTVRDVGLGMRVAWQAGHVPRRFHLVASAISTTSMALQLPRVLGGRPLSGTPHVDRLAEHAVVRFARPEVYTFDGELYRDHEVELRVGPTIDVLVPA
jgi:diacylglycerol kinase family enzyme